MVHFKPENQYHSREEFFKGIKHSWESNIKDERYIVDFNEIELVPHFGDYCIFVDRKYRDKGAANKGDNQFLFIEEYGYIFIHPDYPDEVVEAIYSERYKDGEQTNIGIENRDNFVKSLTLIRKE